MTMNIRKLQKKIIANAKLLAAKSNCSYVGPVKILQSIAQCDAGKEILANRNINTYRLARLADNAPAQVATHNTKGLSAEISQLFASAYDYVHYDLCDTTEKVYIAKLIDEVLNHWIREENGLSYVSLLIDDGKNILECEILQEKIKGTFQFNLDDYDPLADEDSDCEPEYKQKPTILKSAPTLNLTPPKKKNEYYESREETEAIVRKALRDLGAEAKHGLIKLVIGRDDEVSRIIETLQRQEKSNVLLVGQAGVGKTAIAEALAIALSRSDAPKRLQQRPVYALSLACLLSGTRFRGDFEQRMVVLIEILKKENAIVFIDEIHTLMNAGNAANKGLDAVNMLKPHIARSDFSIIGATTFDEVDELRKDEALMRRMNVITVNEPSLAQMEQIMEQVYPGCIKKYGIESIDDGVLNTVLTFADRVEHNQNPDKALDILYQSCVECENRDTKSPRVLTADHVRAAAVKLGIIPNPENARRFDEHQFDALTVLQDEYDLAGEYAHKLAQMLAARRAFPSSVSGMDIWRFTGISSVTCYDMAQNIAKFLDVRFCNLSGQRLSVPSGIDWLLGSPGAWASNSKLTRDIDIDPNTVVWLGDMEHICENVRDFINDIQRDGYYLNAKNRRIYTRKALFIVSSKDKAGHEVGFLPSASTEQSHHSWPNVCTNIHLDVSEEEHVTLSLKKAIPQIFEYMGLDGSLIDFDHSVFVGLQAKHQGVQRSRKALENILQSLFLSMKRLTDLRRKGVLVMENDEVFLLDFEDYAEAYTSDVNF